MAKRVLSAEEADVWRLAMRDIKPLRAEPAPVSVPSNPVSPLPDPAASRSRKDAPPSFPLPVTSFRPPPKAQELRIGARGPGLDDTSWRRLSTGATKVDAVLDLHGYVVQDAFLRLIEFLRRARARNWRCVEIVTGLGNGGAGNGGGGAIRRELPHWLQRPEIRPAVLAVVHAHPGNQGAVRILLRRRR